jgi:hypothetical protein
MLNVAVRKKFLFANPCAGVEFRARVEGLFRPHYVAWSEQQKIARIPAQPHPDRHRNRTSDLKGATTRFKSTRSLVGAGRFERPTPCAQGRCATRLRYAPTFAGLFILNYFPAFSKLAIGYFPLQAVRHVLDRARSERHPGIAICHFNGRFDGMGALFITQRDRRVHRHRPPRRDVTGGQRYRKTQAGDRRERRRVGRGHAVEQLRQQAGKDERAGHSGD